MANGSRAKRFMQFRLKACFSPIFRTFTHSHSRSLALTGTRAHKLTRTLTRAPDLGFDITIILTHAMSLLQAFSQALSLTLTRSHGHSRTHTYTHTCAPSLGFDVTVILTHALTLLQALSKVFSHPLSRTLSHPLSDSVSM